jgi:hypothetical protein
VGQFIVRDVAAHSGEIALQLEPLAPLGERLLRRRPRLEIFLTPSTKFHHKARRLTTQN